MADAPTAREEIPLRRFRRQADRLVEIDRSAAAKIDLLFFDPFQIVGQYLEDVAVSYGREAALVADLRRLRRSMAPAGWIVLRVDLLRIDLVKRTLDAAGYRKVRLAHVVLDGRPEHDEGLVFHPIHNRLTWAVAAKGGRSRFRSFLHKGGLPLAWRFPHEAAAADLILHHSDDEDVIAMTDGMLADDAASLDLTPVIAHPSGD